MHIELHQVRMCVHFTVFNDFVVPVDSELRLHTVRERELEHKLKQAAEREQRLTKEVQDVTKKKEERERELEQQLKQLEAYYSSVQQQLRQSVETVKQRDMELKKLKDGRKTYLYPGFTYTGRTTCPNCSHSW